MCLKISSYRPSRLHSSRASGRVRCSWVLSRNAEYSAALKSAAPSGADLLATEASSHRDPVVAINHVVIVVELVHVDGWQLIALDHRPVDSGPAVPQPAVDGEESRVEVLRFDFRRGRADHLCE